MADSIRNQAINLGIKIDGLDSLLKVDKQIDSIVSKVDKLNNLSAIHVPSTNNGDLDKLDEKLGNIKKDINQINHGSVAPEYNSRGIDQFTHSAQQGAKNNKEYTKTFDEIVNSTDNSSKSVADLDKKLGGLGSTSSKTTEKTNTLNKSARNTHKSFKDITSVGSSVIDTFNNMTIALVPLGVALKNAFDQSTKLADEYNVIKNLEVANDVSPKSAKKTIGQMEKANRNLSLTYGLDQNDLAKGSEELIRRGYSGKQDLASHKYFAQSALATKESYNDIINSDAPVIEQFGYKNKAGNSVSKMRKYTKNVLNKMAYIADITAGDNRSFGEAFKFMGSSMHQNHQSLDTALGAVGTLSNFGINGTIAGTSLRQIISRLNRSGRSKTIKAGLADFGLTPKSLQDRKGNLLPLTTIFNMLRRGAKNKKLTSSQVSGDLQEIFGQYAFNSAQVLLDNGKNFKYNVRKSQRATGKNYIGRLASKNLNSLQGQINLTKSKLKDVGMEFARDIAPTLAKVLKAINGILTWIGKLPHPVRKAMTYFTTVGAGIGAAKIGKGILGNVGKFLGITSGAEKGGQAVGKAVGAGSKLGKIFSAGNVFSIGAGAVQGGVEIAQGIDYDKKGKYAKRNNSVGKGIGSLAGTGIGFGIGAMFGLGPLGAMVGSQVGDFIGGVGGDAVTGYNLKHAPKNKFSGQNIGWSFHNWQKQVGSWWNKKNGPAENLHAFSKTFGEDWRGTGRRIGSFGKWVGDSWNGTKRNIGNFGKWASDSWHGTTRNVGNFFGGIGRGIGNVGKGIGNGVNYVLSGKIGSDAHDVWKKAITKSHYFFVSLPKNFNNLKKNVGKIWNDTWQNINNNRYVKAFKKGKLIQTGLSDIEKNTRGFRQRIGKVWNDTWKGINGNRYVKAIKKGKLIQTGLSDIEKNTRSFRQSFGKVWNGLWNGAKKHFSDFGKDVHKKWDKVWGVINDNRYVKAFKKGNLFGQIFDDVRSRFDKFKKSFQKVWGKFWDGLKNAVGGFGKWVGDSWNGTVNNIKGTINDVNYAFGGNGKVFTWKKKSKKSTSTKTSPIKVGPKGQARPMMAYASGGSISKNALALVGEEGAELAYKKGSPFARLLGLNGASVEKLHSGEHILNARDTRKVLNGGLGTTLGAYAGGTNSLGATKKVNSSYDKINEKTKSTWGSIERTTKHKVVSTKNSVLSNTKSMERSFKHNLSSIHSSALDMGEKTAKGFGKKFNKIKNYTSDAMEGTRKALNVGIAGIDKMLVQFGGNGSVIDPVKFATGSNGKLSQNTLAMINDAPVGERQESVIRDNKIMFPKGDNLILPLRKNDQVLNGSQTASLAKELGLPHFAKGSGVSNSQLAKIALANAKHPVKAFNNMFTKNVKPSGTDIKKGLISNSKGATVSLGGDWSNALWKVITGAMGESNGHGGTREAFLKYAESHFDGKPYRMGATGPDYYDCSGMVETALKHFGIDIGRTTVAMQNSSGVQYLGKDLGKTTAGDLVIYGHGSGALGHVGIIKNPAKDSMFNETVPSARVSSISGPKSMGYGYYRIKGLHDANAKTDKANTRLEKLVKSELGSSALKWISKNLGETISSGFTLAGDVGARIKSLAKALKGLDHNATKNGISAIVGNWLLESTLDPKAVNPDGGASGLGQWLGSRLTSLKAFARKRGTSWANPATQLLFALKHDSSNSSIFRSILEGKGSVTDLATKFSNEWERGGYTGAHVAKAREASQVLNHFRNGGTPTPHTKSIINEDGGEAVEFESPVHIFSKDEAERKLKLQNQQANIANKVMGARTSSPTVNIKVTGNYIDSPERVNQLTGKIKNMFEELFAERMQEIGDNYGDDTSL